jgi:hypothetical protein
MMRRAYPGWGSQFGVDRAAAWCRALCQASLLVCCAAAATPLAPPVALASPATEADEAAAPRDFAKYPAIVESDSSEDIYALGDIHGDYDRATALLYTHHLLAAIPTKPEDARWSGGHATLVCTGDYVDKWTDGLKVVQFLQALQTSARAAGGQVYLLLGNHEVEFLADPKGSKTSDFADELKAAGYKPSDVAKGKVPLGAFLRGLPIGARVREWFFSHAGNTAGRTLTKLSHDVESAVDSDGFGASILSADDSIVEARLSPSVWWESSGDPVATLTAYTTALGVKHLVIGHQPGSYTFAGAGTRDKGTVYQALGMVFLIDAGMSRGVDYSNGALLRITGSGSAAQADVLAADGSVKTLWHG